MDPRDYSANDLGNYVKKLFQLADVNLSADKSRELLQGNHAGGYHILGQLARAMHA